MRSFLSFLGAFVTFSALLYSSAGFGLDLDKFQQQLAGEGVIGEIHGANHVNGVYVFTFREKNFFDYTNFSLFAGSAEARQILATLKRHDYVRLKGEITNPKRSQMHIRATSIEVTKAWDVTLPHREQEAKLPQDLWGKREFVGRIHAVAAEGRVLVVEYKDAVIPVPVPEKFLPLTKNLNRSDKVRIHFEEKDKPENPTHITPDPNLEKPIELLNSARSQHGQLMTQEGALVLFPKSPQVQFDVYALQADIGDGVVREYTLVNFENPDLFKKIREKLAQVWAQGPADAVFNGRNKLVNPKIMVKAKGKINFVDPSQANPQVILDKLDDLTFTIAK
jgi:hypothetical protein